MIFPLSSAIFFALARFDACAVNILPENVEKNTHAQYMRLMKCSCTSTVAGCYGRAEVVGFCGAVGNCAHTSNNRNHNNGGKAYIINQAIQTNRMRPQFAPSTTEKTIFFLFPIAVDGER